MDPFNSFDLFCLSGEFDKLNRLNAPYGQSPDHLIELNKRDKSKKTIYSIHEIIFVKFISFYCVLNLFFFLAKFNKLKILNAAEGQSSDHSKKVNI